MASGITLTAGVRQNLLSLQDTASLMATTQNRLATGKKVNSALDNPGNFFLSQSLGSRATDLNSLLDSIGQATQALKAASRLQAIRDGWDKTHGKLDEALLYNRKLWSIFLTSATDSENPLPTDIRQNVANLGLFVMNQTVSVLADPQPERLNTLININRELAAGLRNSK